MNRTPVETEALRVPGNGIHHPGILKAIAYFFSIVLHPLFIPLIAAWYLVYIQPGVFPGFSPKEEMMVVIRVGYNTIFFPAVTVLLLKAVGFIKSIHLKTRRERIIPIIATNLFYFWVYLVLKNQPEIPFILTGFILGVFITSSAALLSNIYFKISLHALGMGGLCGLMLILILLGYSSSLFLPVMLVLLLTGVVCTSRLIVSDHTPFEIYSGVLVGIICQLIGFLLVI